MGICRSLYHSFHFVNMRFAVMESLLQNFVISFFTLTYVPLMNKFHSTENNFLPRLIKQESYRSSHCIL